MGSLQTELVRVQLADPDQYRFEINIQALPLELREPMRRLKALEEKFPLMEKSLRLMYALEHATAITLNAKVTAINRVCDYLDTL